MGVAVASSARTTIPFPLASVLVEPDARTGFTDRLVHAGGKVNRPPELRRDLLYVVVAEATNMGLGAMAESCGMRTSSETKSGSGGVETGVWSIPLTRWSTPSSGARSH
ncbi:MAG: Tn3 family transposase [Actinoallomurus sp.]